LVLPKADAVPGIVTAGLPTVAIRMPAHPIALRLIEEADTPIAAPSANLFGFLSPTTAEHVRKQLDGKVDMILDGGKCPVGVESTILDLTGQEPIVLRPGGLAIEDIEKAIGKVRIAVHTPERPQSPGQLPRHYSPRTPMIILEVNNVRVPSGKKVGLLAFKRSGNVLPYDVVEVLSPNGDLREAAANLFSCLHRLDRAGLDIIYAEPVPETGLGLAIMNRLRKAAGQNHHGISEVR
jgi:L-threonylcarbamoyladenylate synthase